MELRSAPYPEIMREADAEMRTPKLVCFDLDDTLIREIHSVMLLCITNGKEKEHSIIQAQEEAGELDYIAADYRRAALLNGLEESRIAKSFLEIAKPLKNIRKVVDALHKEAASCILITVGPKQVAKTACDVWNFDGFYGSDYEVVNGVFSGKIRSYIKAGDKVRCLIDYCERNGIKPDDCAAVGDGSTDIPMFEYCGTSVAINAKPEVKQSADILQYMI